MEKTLDQKFKEFIENSVCEILNITLEQYSDFKLDGAKKVIENNYKYKSYFTRTGAFWDCYLHRVQFVDLQIITAQRFDALNNIDEPYTASLYYQLITENFTLPSRVISLINKQHRIQFEQINDSKAPKRRSSKRVLINQKDLFNNNLNTI